MEQTCKACNFWQPKYFQMGRCSAEGQPNAKFFVTEDKVLLTAASFCCQAFVQIQDVNDSTI